MCTFDQVSNGFLGKIQRGELSMNDWPSKEDPYTLFRDLVLLTNKFATLSPDLWTINDGCTPVYPCLPSQLTKPLGHRSFKRATHCGIRPHYWPLGHPLVGRWAEFGKGEEDSYVIAMPDGEGAACAAVNTLVRENVTDWRAVCAFDFDLINRGAMFYAGPSKRSGRWVSFLGEGKL